MLVLTRRLKEKIVFPSIGTEIQVLEAKGGQVRLGINAPSEVPVLREELTDQVEAGTGAEPEIIFSSDSESLREFAHRIRNHLNDIGLNLAVLQQQLGQSAAAPARTITRMEEELQKLRQELEEQFRRLAGRLEEAHTTT